MKKPTKPVKPIQPQQYSIQRTEEIGFYPYVEENTKKLVLLNEEDVPDYWERPGYGVIADFQNKYSDNFHMTFETLKVFESLLPCDSKDVEINSYERSEDDHRFVFIWTKHLTDEEYNENIKEQSAAVAKHKEALEQYNKDMKQYAIDVQKWKAEEAKAKIEKLEKEL